MTKLETITAEDLQNRTYEPTHFLVDELIPEGLHILAGAPKIGKSWLALWLCLCVSQGQALWNFATTQGEALYLSLEDSFQRIQTRLFDLTEDAPPTLHETYFKLIIATGMRRGECCALKWEDINYTERSIHVCRNAVKTTGDEIIVKAPKTKAGNRYVYFSAEMESLLREYEAFCAAETARQDLRKLTKDDYVFRRKGMQLPMTPSTFTWRFKKNPPRERSARRSERPQSAPHGGKSVHRQRHRRRHGCRTLRTQPAIDHAGYLPPRVR